MLNNIKFDPFNPSNNNTIHKKHSLCQPSKCVHINGKVDTHLDQVSAHADTSNNHKNILQVWSSGLFTDAEHLIH